MKPYNKNIVKVVTALIALAVTFVVMFIWGDPHYDWPVIDRFLR